RRRRARIMPKLGLRLRARLPLEHRGDVQGLLPPKRQGGVRGVLPPTRWGGLGRLLPLEALFHQAGLRAAPKLPQAVPEGYRGYSWSFTPTIVTVSRSPERA